MNSVLRFQGVHWHAEPRREGIWMCADQWLTPSQQHQVDQWLRSRQLGKLVSSRHVWLVSPQALVMLALQADG